MTKKGKVHELNGLRSHLMKLKKQLICIKLRLYDDQTYDFQSIDSRWKSWSIFGSSSETIHESEILKNIWRRHHSVELRCDYWFALLFTRLFSCFQLQSDIQTKINIINWQLRLRINEKTLINVWFPMLHFGSHFVHLAFVQMWNFLNVYFLQSHSAHRATRNFSQWFFGMCGIFFDHIETQ